jgi:hypothetical protein
MQRRSVLDKKNMQPKARSFSLRLRVFASLRFFLKVLQKKTWEKRKDAKGRIWRVSKKFLQTRFLSSTEAETYEHKTLSPIVFARILAAQELN